MSSINDRINSLSPQWLIVWERLFLSNTNSTRRLWIQDGDIESNDAVPKQEEKWCICREYDKTVKIPKQSIHDQGVHESSLNNGSNKLRALLRIGGSIIHNTLKATPSYLVIDDCVHLVIMYAATKRQKDTRDGNDLVALDRYPPSRTTCFSNAN